MYKVAVLMATYNGERYLEEQLQSILAQQGVELTIWVRDDGSTDSTHQILDAWKEKGCLDWYTGSSLGPAHSFMDLLQTAPDADFYAFSDQDDYWLPGKLQVAVSCLTSAHERGEECLYFCQTQLVDKELNFLPSPQLNLRQTFAEALIYQFIGGNTMVLNHRLRSVLNSYKAEYVCMHDVWIYDVAMAIRAYVHFDKEPQIYYRQHGNNVTGNGLSAWTEWKRRFKRLVQKREHSRYRTACEIREGFQFLMDEENLAVLCRITDYTNSLSAWWRLLTDPTFECGDKRTNLFFRLAVFVRSL